VCNKKCCGRDWFLVNDELWDDVIVEDNDKHVFMCQSCFEKTIGRKLEEKDYKFCRLNDAIFNWHGDVKGDICAHIPETYSFQ
jgi:hypothetical protein